jgi:hypothetical protein
MKVVVFCVVAPCSMIQIHVSGVLTASVLLIELMVEAGSTYETSVNFYQTTRCNNPEDSHLQMNMCFFALSARSQV